MEQRDPQMASVKPSDVNTAEVVKHMEESYKNDRLDHSLQKLSSIARGESTVKCFEKDQQKIGWFFPQMNFQTLEDIRLAAYHLVRMTISEQIKLTL